MMQIIHFYKDLRGLAVEFNLVLKRMLACPKTSMYYRSSYHKNLINECVKKYLTYMTDADLAAIVIRSSMMDNKDLKTILGSYKYNNDYFS
jgi:hypothetical protein